MCHIDHGVYDQFFWQQPGSNEGHCDLQADCLRHLTDCFATMLELEAGTTKSCSPAVVSQVI